MTARQRSGAHAASAALLAHAAFWFGLLCATPAFIALNNPEDVVFRVGALLAWTGGVSLLLSLFGWKAASLAGERTAWWLSRCLLAAALVLALQGNIVHDLFYYGAFNGEHVDLHAYGWKFWTEWLLWLAAWPITLALLARLRHLPAWLPALPLLSFALLLGPAWYAPRAGQSGASGAEIPVDDAVFAFSSVRNLVHLLPDGLQGDVVRQALEEHPDLAAAYQGFTLFTDHLGLYQGTAPALHTILTGEPVGLKKGFSYERVTPEVLAGSYQNELARHGYQVDYVPISNFICIERAASCHARPFNDMKARGYFRHHSEDVLYSARLLADLTLFRLAPMYLKEQIYNDGRWLFADTTLDGSSPWPDPVVREWVAQLHVVDDRPVYKWYHFIGTHTPAKWDADCGLLHEPAEDRAAYVAQATCVLTSIAALLQVMKEAGIYDQTAFVISGDHGHNVLPDDLRSRPLNSGLLGSLTGTARPALLVKRLNSREPLQFSTAPTHLRDVAPTALALLGIDSEAPSVFDLAPAQHRARMFRHYSIPDLWSGKPIPYVEYTVGGPARDASNWRVSDIQDYLATPASYAPLNKSTGAGFVMGAHLREPPDDDRSSWVTGRQLAFVIGIDDPDRAHTLELRMHFPAWLSGQAFTVEFNGATPWQSPQVQAGDEPFWQSFSVPLDTSRQRAGRNFVSIVFAQLSHPPDTDSWRGSALIESISLAPVDQARAHQ